MIEVGEETWGSRLAEDVRGAGRQPLGGDALAALRHLADGGALAGRGGPGRGRGRLGLRADARLRPRLPRRALRHRPRRRGAAGRRRPPRGAARRAAGARGSTGRCSAWSASRAGSVPGVSPEDSANGNETVELPLFTPRRVVQTAVVVLALLGRDLLPLPEAGRPGRRAEQARRSRAGLDRGRDRLQRPRLRHLHRALQGGGRRQRAARSPGSRPTRSTWPAWRRRCSSRRPAPGASRSPTGRCARPGCAAATWRGGWSPSSPCTTPSTRSR